MFGKDRITLWSVICGTLDSGFTHFPIFIIHKTEKHQTLNSYRMFESTIEHSEFYRLF